MTAFHLYLFSTDEKMTRSASCGGLSGIVIDWENKNKAERQANKDTQINYDTADDLRRMSALAGSAVICRVNKIRDIRESRREIDMALECGTGEILLPMVRTIDEVEDVLNCVAGRCGVGVMIETDEAVNLARELGQLPLSRAYIGLNDLAIDRRKTNIFDSLEDGTIDYVREFIKAPFGFAGLTLPELGHPILCRLLISEMARLECSFTFLRRSFLRDVKDKDPSVEVRRIYKAVEEAFRSGDEEKTANREDIKKIIKEHRL